MTLFIPELPEMPDIISLLNERIRVFQDKKAEGISKLLTGFENYPKIKLDSTKTNWYSKKPGLFFEEYWVELPDYCLYCFTIEVYFNLEAAGFTIFDKFEG